MDTNVGKLSVTEILSRMYPFDPTFFEQALSAEGIEKKRDKWLIIPGSIADKANELRCSDVSYTLLTLGTEVHRCAFMLGTFGYCHPHSNSIVEPFVNGLQMFFQETGAIAIEAEVYLENDEYFGTTDGVYAFNYKGEWVIGLVDWKTWKAYKFIYGILEDPVKPMKASSSDIKKTGLQLSMYSNLLKQVNRQFVVWVKPDGYEVIETKYDLTPYEVWKSGLYLK